MRCEPVDLVLVNRKLDADYSDGMEILKAIKADSALAPVPVMLVSNYANFAKQRPSRPARLKALAKPSSAARQRWKS